MTKQAYIPGMCNINEAEIASRKKAMWFGVVLSVVLFGAMLAFSLPVALRLFLFVPIYIAAIGYLQVKNKFCVAYGTSGKQNAEEESTDPIDVMEKEALAADKKKSLRMNLQALGVTVAFVALSLLIPVL